MSDSDTRFAILVVEDEALVAFDMEDMLHRLGYSVVGPALTLDDGLKLAEAATLHGAVLDVNLTEGNSRPIAERLKERGIPFTYVTGYDKDALSAQALPEGPSLMKPVGSADLNNTLARLLEG